MIRNEGSDKLPRYYFNTTREYYYIDPIEMQKTMLFNSDIDCYSLIDRVGLKQAAKFPSYSDSNIYTCVCIYNIHTRQNGKG
jgi:hypothetical protein